MQILFNNLDGLGFINYTRYVRFGPKAVITRTLNAPSTCHLSIIPHGKLLVPQASARLQILSNTNVYLFTGFVTSNPQGVSLGISPERPAHEFFVDAISDEAQLDAVAWKTGTTLFNSTAAQNWYMLELLAAQKGLQVTLSDGLTAASRVILPAGNTWSQIAGKLASDTRSSYRALNGVIEIAPIGARAYSIPSHGSQITFSPASIDNHRWLADDITVFGHVEPDAYITEIFEGNGVTSSFTLSALPFRPSASQVLQLADQFQGNALNPQLWMSSDAGGHLGLTDQGLTCAGGSGRPAESVLTSVQAIELGGTILAEAKGVQISNGSQGIVLGLFTTDPAMDTCFVGFNVATNGGDTTLTSIVNGSLTGSVAKICSTTLYVLRIFIKVPTWERVSQSYSYQNSPGPAVTGGSVAPSSGEISLELQDISKGILGTTITLYEGVAPSIPASCYLSPVVSGSLMCSIQSISCKQTTPLQVTSMMPGGTPISLKAAMLSQGGACHLENTGTLSFYPAAVPAAGTRIFVKYRNSTHAVARRTSTSSVPGETSYVGRVLHPPAWSSLDCESAAEALLNYGKDTSAAVKGTYCTLLSLSDDFWPGDQLVIGESILQTDSATIIRKVDLSLLNAELDLLEYSISFSNDQADLLSLQLTTDLPETGLIPLRVTGLDQALPPLSALQVTTATTASLSVDAGSESPLNGGFEVRRRDYTFGLQNDSDLVLRTSGRNFSIPRVLPVEQFFVRMYDGNTPPRYSATSAAIYVNPLS